MRNLYKTPTKRDTEGTRYQEGSDHVARRHPHKILREICHSQKRTVRSRFAMAPIQPSPSRSQKVRCSASRPFPPISPQKNSYTSPNPLRKPFLNPFSPHTLSPITFSGTLPCRARASSVGDADAERAGVNVSVDYVLWV